MCLHYDVEFREIFIAFVGGKSFIKRTSLPPISPVIMLIGPLAFQPDEYE